MPSRVVLAKGDEYVAQLANIHELIAFPVVLLSLISQYIPSSCLYTLVTSPRATPSHIKLKVEEKENLYEHRLYALTSPISEVSPKWIPLYQSIIPLASSIQPISSLYVDEASSTLYMMVVHHGHADAATSARVLMSLNLSHVWHHYYRSLNDQTISLQPLIEWHHVKNTWEPDDIVAFIPPPLPLSSPTPLQGATSVLSSTTPVALNTIGVYGITRWDVNIRSNNIDTSSDVTPTLRVTPVNERAKPHQDGPPYRYDRQRSTINLLHRHCGVVYDTNAYTFSAENKRQVNKPCSVVVRFNLQNGSNQKINWDTPVPYGIPPAVNSKYRSTNGTTLKGRWSNIVAMRPYGILTIGWFWPVEYPTVNTAAGQQQEAPKDPLYPTIQIFDPIIDFTIDLQWWWPISCPRSASTPPKYEYYDDMIVEWMPNDESLIVMASQHPSTPPSAAAAATLSSSPPSVMTHTYVLSLSTLLDHEQNGARRLPRVISSHHWHVIPNAIPHHISIATSIVHSN
jgi:hypothetical protein